MIQAKSFRKLIIFIVLVAVCLTMLASCAEIKPAMPGDDYATQNRLTAAEYSIYINRQITSFVNELTARMMSVRTAEQTGSYSAEIDMADESLSIMQRIRNAVSVTYQSKGQDEDKVYVLEAMDVAIDNMKSYISDLEKGKNTKKYFSAFQNDINALTGLANIYYE